MCKHVIFEGLRQAEHKKVQSALHNTAKQVRADQSATTQASRQNWRELACRLSVCIARRVLKTNEEIEICPAYETIQALTEAA